LKIKTHFNFFIFFLRSYFNSLLVTKTAILTYF
jgi:hypothetical protein